MSSQPHDTVPGVPAADAAEVVDVLAGRLNSLIDLQLTLKHIHWNVVGPSFLSVHEMVDTQVGPVREMTDEVAERMRTLGGVPVGTPAAVAAARDWGDYDLRTASVYVHLKALDRVYEGVIRDHRRAFEVAADVDPVTEDLLIGQTARLEQFQWFVRSFVERSEEPTDPDWVSPAERAADRRDAGHAHDADRMPTEDEASRADQAARDIDLDRTGRNYREMTRVGANVKGEGEI